MTHHRQVLTGVLAPVDEGVVPLVRALTKLGVQTTESCQGPPARVYFRYGEHWRDPYGPLAEFTICKLGPFLSEKVGHTVDIQVGFLGPNPPNGVLTVHEGGIEETVAALKQFAEVHGETPQRGRP